LAGQILSSGCDVVIVNYNAGALLTDCVLSVFAAGAARAIVVDNHSADGSLEYMEHTVKSDGLVVIRNGENLGFAAACNIGERASSSAQVLFLNPDCILAPDALFRMVAVLHVSPEVGMVGGFLCNPDGTEQPGGRRVFPTPKRAFMRAFGLSRLARFFPKVFSDFLLHQEPLPIAPAVVEAISGACMLVKRTAMDDVGLWDDAYFLHCEDLDWCMRFKLKAWKILFVPDAKVTHVWGSCSRSRPFFVEWHKHHGMLRFYKKFFRHQYSGLLWGLVVVGVWLRFVMVAAYYSGRLVLTKTGIRRG
jgi:GT2 family glycosyltransferase